MKYLFILITCLLLIILQESYAQKSLSYFFPGNNLYDKSIPTPEEVLGFQVGEWHVSHDQLLFYLKKLAEASERITIEEYGRTYENRPLIIMTISNPENLKNIKDIRAQHLLLSNPERSQSLNVEEMPVVIWMGYSIHGNEHSGSNAALLVAYHLAAAQGEEMDLLLKNSIILLDPCQNPDGLNRSSSWFNAHKSKNINSDPNNLGSKQSWPTGRTNHYWFDLNRDWLTVQLPESQGRIKKYHEWKPNILTDHHEMGSDNTFFFQPGIPSRNHPLTPKENIALTEKIAGYHARALDEIGSLYFTRENYDDYFYGKGSTYPDINGAVGILFEQASSSGLAQETINGTLTFPFTIKNQVATSLSTLKAGIGLKNELLNHQRNFYRSSLHEASKDHIKAIIFSADNDPARTAHFTEILLQHDINVYQLATDININNQKFPSHSSFLVPFDQPQYKLIQALFEQRTSFTDSLFYDISAWTLPLAFDLNFEKLDKKSFSSKLLDNKLDKAPFPEGKIEGGPDHYAYVFDWHSYYAPGALYAILEKGLKVKVATQPFSTADGKKFSFGSILISKSFQPNPGEVYSILKEAAHKFGIEVYGLTSGFSEESISLGSPSFKELSKPEILLIAGQGDRDNSTEVGEIWHLLDQKFDIHLTLASIEHMNKINLDRYNLLILPDGNYSHVNNTGKENLRTWLNKGNVVIAMKGAGKWLADNGFSNMRFKTAVSSNSEFTDQRMYNEYENYSGAQNIGGAIFEAQVDLSHPINYGYQKSSLSLFKSNKYFLELPANPYAAPIRFSSTPLQSGFISDHNLQLLKNSPAIGISTVGNGTVITMTDNPNFRAFWYGTNKIFFNSIFFGKIINKNTSR
ncbi:M14 family metallopeptidase [soil metagenome]